ncbi:MAG: glycosyltransferase [Steroidobacteraceae bacterium]
MKVLITNHTLSTRTGTETYVRDLALGLLAKGHSPIVYSPQGGAIADELRNLTIPVVDDLARIATHVDLIHGHHRHETMTALLHFPGVPAIFFVHDWHSWHDLPPAFPRILRYVAIDGTRRDRLLLENGIPESMVTLLPNGVDTQRFRPRAPLPTQPKRGLVFSNYVRSFDQIRELRDACMQSGMSLDVVGAGMQRSVTQPEQMLCGYDLVFAMGRSALEAMAVGAGVIVWGLEGMGEFVRPDNFERLQDSNFGRRALRHASAAELAAEIRRFDREAARAIQERVRNTLAQSHLVERHLQLYEEVIRESTVRRWQPDEELRMAANYMKSCLPAMQQETQHKMMAQRRRRQRLRLIDITWICLSLFVVAFGVRVEMLAFNAESYGLSIGGLAVSLMLCFGLFTLRRHLRGELIA